MNGSRLAQQHINPARYLLNISQNAPRGNFAILRRKHSTTPVYSVTAFLFTFFSQDNYLSAKARTFLVFYRPFFKRCLCKRPSFQIERFKQHFFFLDADTHFILQSLWLLSPEPAGGLRLRTSHRGGCRAAASLFGKVYPLSFC